MSAHSAIQAKYVQSQGAQATAICLTFARKSTGREGRASNSTLFLLCFVFQPKGLQYFPDIPGRFRWLPTSAICLILLFVNPPSSGTLALFATVGFLTWSILLTQFTQTCLCAKQCSGKGIRVQFALSDQHCTYVILLFKNAILGNIADASFSSWKKRWGEQRTLSTLGRQLVKGRLCSNKRQIQQCNGDLWQRAKQLQDSRTFVTMHKNTLIYIDFMRAASLLIMMFSASIDWCKNKNWIRRHEKTTPNKKWNIPDARHLSLPAKQCNFLQNYQ